MKLRQIAGAIYKQRVKVKKKSVYKIDCIRKQVMSTFRKTIKQV